MYLDPAVHSLQRAASSFQTLGQVAGEAAGRAVGITPARMHAAAAQLQQDAHGAAVDGTKEVIRTIGIDSNTPGFGTPDSYYGAPSLAPGHMAPSHAELLHMHCDAWLCLLEMALTVRLCLGMEVWNGV